MQRSEKIVLNLKRAAAFIIIAAMVFSMSACGTESPSKVTEKFLTAIQKNDTDVIKETYEDKKVDIVGDIWDEDSDSDDSENSFDEEILKQLEKKIRDFDYEVSDEKIDGDKATVNVKITTYDFGNAFSSFFSKYMEQGMELAFSGASDSKMEELANTLFKKQLNKLKEKKFEKTVKVRLVKKDDKWVVAKLKNDGKLIDAISGGMISTIESIDDSFSDD